MILFLPAVTPSHDEKTQYSPGILDSLYSVLSLKVLKKDPVKPQVIRQKLTFKGFLFDPNTISRQKLLEMGLKPFIVKIIINYRSSGGVFKTKSDLKKIYGLDEELFNKMKPYILLPDTLTRSFPVLRSKEKRKRWVSIDLNMADTSQLKTVFGVGSILANRIIRYRDLLGGYLEMKQLQEVYGLQDSVIFRISEKFFISKTGSFSKLNINTFKASELGKHPYISYSLARQIVNYREIHGEFESDSILMQLHTISDSLFQKLKPYIRN